MPAVNGSAEEPNGPPLGSFPSRILEPPANDRPSKQPVTTTPPLLEGPPLEQASTWSDLLRSVLLTAIPDQYEDREHWGRTIGVVNGVRVKQRGLRIDLSPRVKQVNDGPWHRYQVVFPRPEKNLRLVINQVQSLGPGRFSCAIHLTVKPRITARYEQWFAGVKGLNFTVVSDATVQLHAHCLLYIRTERREKHWLPDVILEPSIQSLKLKLVEVDTQRIGEIRGDLAEEIGNGSRGFIADLLRKQEPKVLKKANAAIAKKRDALRLSPSW